MKRNIVYIFLLISIQLFSQSDKLTTIDGLKGVSVDDNEYIVILKKFLDKTEEYKIGNIKDIIQTTKYFGFEDDKLLIVEGTNGWLGIVENIGSIIWTDKTIIKRGIRNKYLDKDEVIIEIHSNYILTNKRIAAYNYSDGIILEMTSKLPSKIVNSNFSPEWLGSFGNNNLLILANGMFAKIETPEAEMVTNEGDERKIEWMMKIPNGLSTSLYYDFHEDKNLIIVRESSNSRKIKEILKVTKGKLNFRISIPDNIDFPIQELEIDNTGKIKGKNNLLKINLLKGEVDWISEKTNLNFTHAINYRENYFIDDKNDYILKVNLTNGKIEWETKIDIVNFAEINIIKEAAIIVDSTNFTKINVLNGKLVWQATHKLNSLRNVIISETGLISFDWNRRVCKLNLNDGQTIWKSDILKEISIYQSLGIFNFFNDDIVLIQDEYEYFIVKLDEKNGKIEWKSNAISKTIDKKTKILKIYYPTKGKQLDGEIDKSGEVLSANYDETGTSTNTSENTGDEIIILTKNNYNYGIIRLKKKGGHVFQELQLGVEDYKFTYNNTSFSFNKLRK